MSTLNKTTAHAASRNMEHDLSFNYETLEPASSGLTGNQTCVNGLYAELEKCYDTLTILIQGIQTLSNDANRLNNESSHLNNLIQAAQDELKQIKLSINEVDTYLAEIASNNKILQQETLSIKQKVEDMQFASYDGMLIWKVTDVSHKIADSQSGRQTSIYSPPFYSSSIGYKMRARLYLQGDGNA
ncbi:unnamed protein product, partial [Didymodactylos carnosus]